MKEVSNLDLRQILQEIHEHQRKSVVVRWPSPGGPALPKDDQVKSESWAITIANDPEEYFKLLDTKFSRKATHTFKFELASAEQGIELAQGLYKHHELPEEDIELGPDVDVSKPLFLAVHIHYLFD